MLWQSTPTVVVGRHQSVEAEVNLNYLEQQQIHLARRFSGGGAVYHDPGNVNLTFIGTNERPDFEYYLQQTVDCLASIGIATETDQRLGIYIGNEKISGSAQFVHKNRVLYHCTLLFDTDIPVLEEVLQGVQGTDTMLSDKRKVKAVPSVRSTVTNISGHLGPDLDFRRFTRLIYRYFLDEDEQDNRVYHFTLDDMAAIDRLKRSKYTQKEWILHAQL